MEIAGETREVIVELRAINARLARRNSPAHMLWSGLVYGIGFFIGSAIVATILIGVFGPTLARIPFVSNAFNQGKALLQQRAQ